MADIFYRIDLLRAALQEQGASLQSIADLVADLQRVAGYADWNRLLTTQDTIVMARLLAADARDIRAAFILEFRQEWITRFGISAAELDVFFARLSWGRN